MRNVRLPALVMALCAASCRAPAEHQPAATPSAPPRRPNLVFVLVDDMRWDDLGAAGHPFLETPHMDRLAAEGARFTNAFATTPLCSPSRASFLTGQYPHTNGITDNTARESHNLPVFPLDLQQAGYRTGFFGKWHMGNDDSPRPGFDHWVAMPGQGEAIDPSLNVDGQRVQAKGYTTDLLTDYVERFIDRPGDAPFLVYLAHKAIHPNVIQNDDGSLTPLAGQPGGFVAAERHRGRYVGRPMPRRANAFVPPARQAGAAAARSPGCRRSARPPRPPTRRFAAGSRCCWRWTTASAGSSPRWPARASSTTRWWCSRAITATSTASTG